MNSEKKKSGRLTHTQYAWVVIFLTLTSCSDPSSLTSIQPDTNIDSDIQPAIDSVSPLLSVIKIRNDLVRSALLELDESVSRFLSDPSTDNLHNAQQAWSKVHLAWLESRILDLESLDKNLTENIFFESLDELSLLQALLFSTDTTPIEEGFLDSIEGYPDSGLIMDISVSIDEKTLREQHGITAPEEACLGFHPLEYFLWEKTVDDYSLSNAEDHIARRRNALDIIIKLLVKDSNTYLNLSEKLLRSVLPSLSDARKLAFLLETLRVSIEKLNDSLKITSSEEAHSRFSKVNQENPAIHMKRIHHLVKEPVNIQALMKSLDNEKAMQFVAILNGSLSQTFDTGFSKEQRANLIEPVTTLKQLIDDFISAGSSF